MSGSYEGFGIALGSLISGFLIDRKGFKFLWYFASGIAFVVFLADLLLMLIIYLKNSFKSTEKATSNRDASSKNEIKTDV